MVRLTGVFFLGACAAALRHSGKTLRHSGKAGPLAIDDSDVEVVEVPVIQVIMVDDEPPATQNQTHSKQASMSEALPLELRCEREMLMLAMNRSRATRAQACENKANHTNRSIAALQHGDIKAATAAVMATFRDCAKLSDQCVTAMAPDVVKKMRMTGIGVDSHCEKLAAKLDANASAVPKGNGSACEKNATRLMVSRLQHHDLDGAFAEASQGLKTCNALPTPCDFQLGPMLVEELMEVQEEMEEAQMAQFLMAGIRAAQQLTTRVAAKNPNSHVTVLKGHKAPMSLLSLATSTRIVAKTRTVKF